MLATARDRHAPFQQRRRPPVPATSAGVLQRSWARLRSAESWRGLAYHLLRLPLGVVLFAIVWTLWSVALAFVTLPLYNWAVPGGGASLGFGIEIQSWWATLLACLAGIALLSIVPTAVNGLGLLDVVIAQRLLGPGGRLAARVGELEPAGRGSSMRQRKNGGGSNAICTTVHSNGWSLWL